MTAEPLARRPAFRLFVGAQALGSTGAWMLRMATDWLVLELTGSPAAVGTVVALQFLPLLVVGPAAGLVVDRHDRRRLVMASQSATALLAAALAALTVTGAVTVPLLYAAAALLGLVAAVDMPARQVFVGEVAGDADLRTAVSVTNALNQGGGLVGPALAGMLLAQVGDGWSFGVNAALCLAVVLLVAAIRPADLHRTAPVARARGQLREGFAYVLTRPWLAAVVALAGAMGALGLNGPVVLSAFADQVWHTGAAGFGLYNSVSAAGALIGAVAAARLATLRLRTIFAGAAVFAVTEVVAALMPGHVAFVVSLAVVGAATLFFLTSAATYVQLTASPTVRGRVLAIYTPVLLGGHALGGLLQGHLAEQLGVRAGLAVTGALALAATGAVALTLLGVSGRMGPTVDRPDQPGTIDATAPAGRAQERNEPA